MAETIEWLYPDLLSKEGLVYILKQRFIRHAQADLETLQKEELVELYNHYILPLPQRKYRDNRRGREMTRKQILFDKNVKRKSSNDGSDQSVAKKEKAHGPSSGLINNFRNTGSSATRLKPPPSAVSFEKKIVQLNPSKPVNGNMAAGTDGLVIKPCNKKVEVISSETKTHSSGQANKNSQPKKRLHSSGENEDNMQEESMDCSPTKKSIAKITWP